jgi:hypothetical protein
MGHGFSRGQPRCLQVERECNVLVHWRFWLPFHNQSRTTARNLRRPEIAEGWRPRSAFERDAIVSQTDVTAALQRLGITLLRARPKC